MFIVQAHKTIIGLITDSDLQEIKTASQNSLNSIAILFLNISRYVGTFICSMVGCLLTFICFETF